MREIRETYTIKDFERGGSPMLPTVKQINDMKGSEILEILKVYDRALHDKKAEICGLREKVDMLEREGRKIRSDIAERQRQAIEFIGPLNQSLGFANFKGQTLF